MTVKKPVTAIIGLFLAVLVFFPVSQHAKFKPLYSYYNMFYGARSLGMGNAFTAVADDLTAVFRNPAGVAELQGPQIFLDYRTDKMNWDFETENLSVGETTQSYDYQMESKLKNADFISLSVPVRFWDMNWSFAVSYYRYIPYNFEGFSRDYRTGGDGTEPDSYSLTFEGSGGIDVLALTAAFYLTDYLSFGVTYQRFFNSGDMTYTLTPQEYGYTDTYSDKLEDQNLILGLKIKLTKDIIVGMTYSSPFSGTFTTTRSYQAYGDTSATETTSTATLNMPSQYSVGVLVRPYEWMDASFDYTRNYWGRAKLKDYFGSTEEISYPVRGDHSFEQNDTEAVRFGTQLHFPIKKAILFLRAGLSSDTQLFPDAANEKVKLKGISFGVGINLSSILQLDAAYMRQKATWDETAYLDTANIVSTTMTNHIFCVSLTFNFNRRSY